MAFVPAAAAAGARQAAERAIALGVRMLATPMVNPSLSKYHGRNGQGASFRADVLAALSASAEMTARQGDLAAAIAGFDGTQANWSLILASTGGSIATGLMCHRYGWTHANVPGNRRFHATQEADVRLIMNADVQVIASKALLLAALADAGGGIVNDPPGAAAALSNVCRHATRVWTGLICEAAGHHGRHPLEMAAYLPAAIGGDGAFLAAIATFLANLS